MTKITRISFWLTAQERSPVLEVTAALLTSSGIGSQVVAQWSVSRRSTHVIDTGLIIGFWFYCLVAASKRAYSVNIQTRTDMSYRWVKSCVSKQELQNIRWLIVPPWDGTRNDHQRTSKKANNNMMSCVHLPWLSSKTAHLILMSSMSVCSTSLQGSGSPGVTPHWSSFATQLSPNSTWFSTWHK